MIKQSLAFNDILEKKFKILRTSIILGNLRNKDESLIEYEETAREIDRIRSSVYEEHLEGKMYTTVTLEEEKDRLEELISFIEDRVKERNDFVDDYIKITSNFLDELDKVSLENELSNFKNRYNNIEEYLDNCVQIDKLSFDIKKLKDELDEKYENKSNNELINVKLEEELIEEFNKFISRNSFYSELNYTDIDSELSKLDESILEKKSVLDTFMSSYKALINAGITGAEREEYSSYVDDAKTNYYEDVEKKYILEIYKNVLDKQTDYDKLYEKRAFLDNLLNERENLRSELNINNRDDLEYFVNLCKEQYSIIRAQKFNLEDIDKLILDITSYENKLEELQDANNREEILDLVKEFTVDVPEIEKESEEFRDEEQIFEDIISSYEKKPSNLVVSIKDPIKINVKNASDTAKLVMKKVVIVLEPKKFNSKRDKLKEAELELRNEIKEFKIKEEPLDSKNEKNIKIDTADKVEKKSDDVIHVDNTHNIFLDDDANEIGIQLNTKEILDDKNVTEVKELSEIKINANDVSNMSIPTEIFIEEPPVEKEPDLFSVTDPFLDDNEFELNDGIPSDEIRVFMPNLGSIGTVRPNNALSKIEDVVKENEDIILPNLGLVDDTKVDVPIVSENYIS